MVFLGFCFQKRKVIFAPLLEMFKGDKIPLGMNKAVSDLRRTSLKTVGELPGDAGSSSGAATAQLLSVLFHKCHWSCSLCMGKIGGFLKIVSSAEFVY